MFSLKARLCLSFKYTLCEKLSTSLELPIWWQFSPLPCFNQKVYTNTEGTLFIITFFLLSTKHAVFHVALGCLLLFGNWNLQEWFKKNVVKEVSKIWKQKMNPMRQKQQKSSIILTDIQPPIIGMSLERLWFLLYHQTYPSSTSASGAVDGNYWVKSYDLWLEKFSLDHQEIVPVGLKNLWIVVSKLFWIMI